MINITFNVADEATQFSQAYGITVSNSVATVSFNVYKLLKGNFDVVASVQNETEEEYIVQCADPTALKNITQVVADLGNGFHLVKSATSLALLDEVGGKADEVQTQFQMMADDGTNVLSAPLTNEQQWGRLRMVTRSKPIAEEFKLAQTNFTRKPELIFVDSGINFDHVEFAGLETENFYAIDSFNGDFTDTAGHGTGVASAAVGATIGVHTYAKLVSVKVFSETVYPSIIQLGAAFDAIVNRQAANPTVPMIVNMSWNITKSDFIETKINNMVGAGIVVVSAAGNQGSDTANLTPAGMANVVTVAASDIYDTSAGFDNFSGADATITSNYGHYIDLFAPGVQCVSARHDQTDKYMMVSGTSISAGYVSGAMAAIMALVPDVSGPDAMQVLIDYSTKGVLLLDSTKFSANQNMLVYLITADSTYTSEQMSYYLGALDANSPTLTGDSKSFLSSTNYSNATGETFAYAIVWETQADHDTFDATSSVDSNGIITINTPSNIAWAADQKLLMGSFSVTATSQSGSITYKTPTILFFATNPATDDGTGYSGDISTALQPLNAQSFFASWITNMMIK